MVDLNITYRFITAYEYGAIKFVLLQQKIPYRKRLQKQERINDCQAMRYLHIMGDTVATVDCLDQHQDNDDKYEAGLHNFL